MTPVKTTPRTRLHFEIACLALAASEARRDGALGIASFFDACIDRRRKQLEEMDDGK